MRLAYHGGKGALHLDHTLWIEVPKSLFAATFFSESNFVVSKFEILQ